MKTEFKATLNLVMENSFGILDKEDKVEVKVILGIREREVFPYCDKEESGTGWFEIYDIKTGGENWYAEGGLWFEDNGLVDYDGVFSLPECIEEKLKELNYKINL